jgi:hypothetical protein
MAASNPVNIDSDSEPRQKVNLNAWKAKRFVGVNIKPTQAAAMIEVNEAVIPLTKTRKVLD